MKGVFWNSRGLTDFAKHRYLSEMVKEEQINLIALSKIGRDDFSDATHKNFCGAEILFGIVWPHTVVQEASFWGLT